MSSVFLSRFFRELTVLVFAGAAILVGCYGVLLIVQFFTGHGSPGGSTFVFALGFLCLCVSAAVLVICSMKWWSRQHRDRYRTK